MLTLEEILDSCQPLVEAGAALHWLRPKAKAPIEDEWSTAPIYDLATLKRKHAENQNIGIRLGQFSKTPAGFIHVIDVDIRDSKQADDAWEAVRSILGLKVEELPVVVSGSGGESRHVYILTEKPLKSRKIAKSEGFSHVFDPKLGREVKKFDWEIDFFGTGKQVVIPPSIHPDTGQPYRWEREFDFAMLDLGIGPVVNTTGWPVAEVEDESEDDDDDLFAIVRAEPLDISDEEVDSYIADVPEEWVDDRETWLTVGAGLSHQYKGGQIGFEKWCDWSRQSEKFNLRDSKIVWRSFKGAKNPITFRSVIQAAQQNRLQSNLPTVIVQEEEDPLADLLGSGQMTVWTEKEPVKVNPIADWTSLLSRNDEGAPTGTLHNSKLIIENDVRVFGCVAFNQFRNSIVLVNTPKQAIRDREQVKKPMVQLEGEIWKVPDPVNGTGWTDSHSYQVRLMIEAPKGQGGYGIKISDRDLLHGLDIVATNNRYHPVLNYLESCASGWDGIRRADALFIKYLGCEDTPYHREAARLMLLGAVTRVFEPGHKFDFVPILEGIQGKRKSTFIRVLGRNWSSELAGDFHDQKAMVEQIQGSWIVEIPELQGFSKADTNVLKAWLSRQSDKARLAYKRFTEDFPRQCIFIGSTNDDEYLRDHTGGRRFWPIRCQLPEGVEIDTDGLEREIDMIWAEAVLMYREMRRTCKLKELPLFLTSEEAKREASELQESRRVETATDMLAGEIQQWLDDPIGTDSGFDDLDPDSPKIYRNETCAVQIWTEMMGKPKGSMGGYDSTKIGHALGRLSGWTRVGQRRTKHYGRQRTYMRVGTDGDDGL
jgi:predicted P-loop ATPase